MVSDLERCMYLGYTDVGRRVSDKAKETRWRTSKHHQRTTISGQIGHGPAESELSPFIEGSVGLEDFLVFVNIFYFFLVCFHV